MIDRSSSISKDAIYRNIAVGDVRTEGRKVQLLRWSLRRFGRVEMSLSLRIRGDDGGKETERRVLWDENEAK
jgi:hypothetical protein